MRACAYTRAHARTCVRTCVRAYVRTCVHACAACNPEAESRLRPAEARVAVRQARPGASWCCATLAACRSASMMPQASRGQGADLAMACGGSSSTPPLEDAARPLGRSYAIPAFLGISWYLSLYGMSHVTLWKSPRFRDALRGVKFGLRNTQLGADSHSGS